MKYLLITPPLTQLNTPYPATAVLKGHLQARGHTVAQADLGIELVNRMLSTEWLTAYAQSLAKPKQREWMMQRARVADIVMRFLHGTDSTLAPRIANRSLLPEGGRFQQLADLEWAFGTSGVEDKARHLATLYLEDIADFIRTHTDPCFDLIRYAEHLAAYAPQFDELHAALQQPPTMIDGLMLQLLDEHLQHEQPDIVAFSIPFPGCLYGALRCAQHIMNRTERPLIALGGGFPNTEWRQISDTRIFEFCDHISLDDGELPLERMAEWRRGAISEDKLVRTFFLRDGKIAYSGNVHENIKADEAATPDFDGLPLGLYFSLCDTINPMQRLWSSGRWNKMMMAHGCYWHKCAFCDTTLDYIGRYDAPRAATVVDRMEQVARQTGISGFHFVDEALPPNLLRQVSEEILRRGLTFSWWGNIRFEQAYTPELCDLMAEAGCVAVSGGLEVASDRLLKMINKGVSVEQATRVFTNFRNAGVMVHTYLMYGFPTETLQETIEALGTVRRMFDRGIIQSAFWHRYAMTCHSPSGQSPERYCARRTECKPNPFCNNEVDWESAESRTGCGHQFDYDIEAVGRGLYVATYNYMNGVGFDVPVRNWFKIEKGKRQY